MSKPWIFRRGVRSSALLLIASFMIVSAVVRLAAEAGPALSRVAAFTASADPDPDPGKNTQPDQTADLGPLLTALNRREANLSVREQALEDRLQALQVAEQAIEERLATLLHAEEELRGTLALADGASERDLTNLTSVYEQMKPKEAAAVFEEMAPEFAAGFLARMRPEVAASVLEGMEPKAAYTISVVLAGRSLKVPTN